MKEKHMMLWLGSYQSDELFRKMLARNIGHASGFASQKGIIKGIDGLKQETELDTVGMISYPPYPVYPKVRVQREEWSRTGLSKDVCIGYINIRYINYIFQGISLKKEIRKWAKTRRGQMNTIFVYEPSVPKLQSALYMKKKYDAKVFVIIPDIPELVNLGANKLVKFAKHIAAKKMRKLFNKVDGFILYSKHMADYYAFSDDKWMLMEGVFDPEEADIQSSDKTGEENQITRLMYCGALDEFRGIPQLLDAFDGMREQDYELWLTGAGRSDQLIYERQKTDARIRHYGYLDSREEVLRLQQQADILIHTRDVRSPAAPYCFPSKLFEYLITGKPVISVDIPGIPEEYFQYMVPIKELTVKGIRDALYEVMNKSREERIKLGAEARNFILQHKNSYVQAQRILEFIHEIKK